MLRAANFCREDRPCIRSRGADTAFALGANRTNRTATGCNQGRVKGRDGQGLVTKEGPNFVNCKIISNK